MQQLPLEHEPIRSELPSTSALWPYLVLTVLLCAGAFSAAADDKAGTGAAQLSGNLNPLIWQYSSDLQTTLDAFGKAVAHFSTGGFATALGAIPADPAAASTAVEDHIMLFKARCHLGLNRPREALDLVRSLRSRHPDSPILAEALLIEARALLQLDNHADALAILENPMSGSDAEVVFLRGLALEGAGKRGEAINAYLQVYSENVAANPSALAEERLRSLAPGFPAKAANREILLRRSENLIRIGRNQDARTLLLKLEGTGVSGLQAQKLFLLLGDADTNLKRLFEALRYLRRVTDPALGAQAAYLMGVCLRALKNEAAFLEMRGRALALYPQSPFTEKLLYSVATYYDVGNRAVPAREAYLALARSFPRGEYVERALWKVAMYSYVEKRYEEALSEFWQCILANPSAGAASAPAYWMGRCCERLGDLEKAAFFYGRAQELANNSYYGQRAQASLYAHKSLDTAVPKNFAGVDFDQASQLLNTIRPDPVTIPLPSGPAVLVIERARQLAAAGLLDLALTELNHGCGNDADTDKVLCYAMSRIYQSKNDHLDAILTLRRAVPDYTDRLPSLLPHEFWDILFPVRHLGLIRQTAARNNLDPNLILALIRQESAFQESARSSANARGLMQVLPTTGRMLAHEAGIANYTVSRLYNPETNIALGSRYLASLLQRYGGRLELALAAYNAGFGRVDQWLQEFGDADMAEFVERIPFGETRGYVKQVISSKAHYYLRTGQISASALNLRQE